MLDSNLIIYSARPEYPGLRRLIETNSPAVSAVSMVEVLGYHKITEAERLHFEEVFATAEVLPVSEPVVTQAIALRQARKMSLGDAIIAATAIVFGQELLTHNIKDFAGIPGLIVVDPIASGDPK